MRKLFIPMSIIIVAGSLAGCHDGPLYALKTINPIYQSEWSKDAELGPTDYQRRQELERLVYVMPTVSDEDQQYWFSHLEAILDNDNNAGMRTLAIRALGGYRGEQAIDLCEAHFNDDSPKVRMAICEVLGRRDSSRSVQLLANAIGEESNEDVRMAAIQAIGNQKSPDAAKSLMASLKSRNPAIRLASVESLRDCTGKSLGDDPEVWIAYLNGDPVQEQQKGLSDQVKELF